MSIRPVKSEHIAQPTMEGAGVHLHRAFGFHDPKALDPFLLFDDFRNDDSAHFKAGFPWHPHRGIETITYVLSGSVEHGDSLGNTGTLGAGDVQWMTAGSGIMHQEMPHGNKQGQMHGFQLWVRDASDPQGVLFSGNRTLIQFDTGDEVTVQAGEEGIRFLLVSGRPIEEPVAWHGPIVMNTPQEIRQAMTDLNNGTFIKPAH